MAKSQSLVLIAPYLRPGSIGPRAERSRRLVAALATAGHRVRAISVDPVDGWGDAGSAELLATAPGPAVGRMSDPGLGIRWRARAAAAAHLRKILPIPDAHARWAASLALDPALEAPPEGVDAAYAVAMPFSSLVLAAILGKRWGAPVLRSGGPRLRPADTRSRGRRGEAADQRASQLSGNDRPRPGPDRGNGGRASLPLTRRPLASSIARRSELRVRSADPIKGFPIAG